MIFGKKKPRKVRKETDLKAFESEDAYRRKKLLLDVAAGVGVMVLIGGLALLICNVVVNEDIRKKVTDMLVNNIPGIIYGGMIIFGIKVHTNS